MKEQLAVMQCGSSQNQQDRNSLMGVSVTALRGKVSCSWEPRSTTKTRCTAVLIQEIYWENHMRVAASAWEQLGLRELGLAIMAFRVFWGWKLVLRGHLCTLRGCLCKGRTLYSSVVYILVLLQMWALNMRLKCITPKESKIVDLEHLIERFYSLNFNLC